MATAKPKDKEQEVHRRPPSFLGTVGEDLDEGPESASGKMAQAEDLSPPKPARRTSFKIEAGSDSDDEGLGPPIPPMGGLAPARTTGLESEGEGRPWGSDRFSETQWLAGGLGLRRLNTVRYSVYKTFSQVVESEDTAMYSTLIQGYSVVPLFTSTFTAAVNAVTSVLFTAVADFPHTRGVGKWLRMIYSILSTMVLFRNILVSFYEVGG
jgi:hypothetical protein